MKGKSIVFKDDNNSQYKSNYSQQNPVQNGHKNSCYSKKNYKRNGSEHHINMTSKRSIKSVRKQSAQNVGDCWSFTQFIQIIVFVQVFIHKLSARIKGIKEIQEMDKNIYLAINDISFDIEYFQDLKKQDLQKQIFKLNNSKNSKAIILKQKQQLINLLPTKIQKEVNSQLAQICQFILRRYNQIPVINPNSQSSTLIDLCISFFIIIQLFYTSIQLSFYLFDIRQSFKIQPAYMIDIIIISFSFEIFLKFNLAYYSGGILVKNKIKIAKRYLKQLFFIDSLAIIPLLFTLTVTEDSSELFDIVIFCSLILVLFKYKSLKSNFQRIERNLTENESTAQWFPLVVLCVQILVLAHLVGLFYYLMAIIEIQIWDTELTWLHTQQLVDKPWIDKYIHSFYWSVSTMVTILLYIPLNNTELLFSIFSIFLMTGMFGYALNTIGQILIDMNKKNNTYKEQRQMVNRFFQNRQIPEKLRQRVIIYLEFLREKQSKINLEEEEYVLNTVSLQLKHQILKEIHSKNIKCFEALTKLFSQEIIDQLFLIINEDQYSPDEIISQGDSDSLYYIEKGQAKIQAIKGEDQKTQNIVTLKENTLFGGYFFFSGQKSEYIVKSVQSCTILRIQREKFVQLLKDQNKDYQIFCDLKDDLIHSQTSKMCIPTCIICQKDGHTMNQCSQVFCAPKMKQIAYEYRNMDTQLRGSYYRTDQHSNHALEFFQDNIEATEEILQNLSADQELQEKFYFWQEMYIEQIPAYPSEYLSVEPTVSQEQPPKQQDSQQKVKDEQILNPNNRRRSSFRNEEVNLSQKLLRQQKKQLSMMKRKSLDKRTSIILNKELGLGLQKIKEEPDQQISPLNNKIKEQNIQISLKNFSATQINSNIEQSTPLLKQGDKQSSNTSIEETSQSGSSKQIIKKYQSSQQRLSSTFNNLQQQLSDNIQNGSLFNQNNNTMNYNSKQPFSINDVNKQNALMQKLIEISNVNNIKRNTLLPNIQDFQLQGIQQVQNIAQNNFQKLQKIKVDPLWDFQTFDKPQNYKYYKPEHNISNIQEIRSRHQTEESIKEDNRGNRSQSVSKMLVSHSNAFKSKGSMSSNVFINLKSQNSAINIVNNIKNNLLQSKQKTCSKQKMSYRNSNEQSTSHINTNNNLNIISLDIAVPLPLNDVPMCESQKIIQQND